MTEHMRQTTRADCPLPCALHRVRIRIAERNATFCTFFTFLLFLTFLHLFSIAKRYFAPILQHGVARCLCQRCFFFVFLFFFFFAENDLDHFDFILFKCLSCEISFSDFVYLLLDRITNTAFLEKIVQ